MFDHFASDEMIYLHLVIYMQSYYLLDEKKNMLQHKA